MRRQARGGGGGQTRAPAQSRLRRLTPTLAKTLSSAVAVLVVILGAAAVRSDAVDLQTPQMRLGPLYAAVEMRRLFPDSKTFADAVPTAAPADLTRLYRAGQPWTDAALRGFVLAHFQTPPSPAPPPAAGRAPPQSLQEHIFSLWPVLTRPPVSAPAQSSLLSLPQPYVVPGGRFRELYYWDSFFTMLGLKADQKQPLIEAMIDDFGSLIDRYGHIPNGTRSYYLSRSQPPFFYAMVGLSAQRSAADRLRQLNWMRREHAYWMAGEDGLRPGEARGHLIRLADGALLNRYHDALSTPRDESYREDVSLATQSGRPAAELYSDLRSASESGWDFSSRWLADGRTLATIRMGPIAPVDLNSLLYGLERAIAEACRDLNDEACVSEFQNRAATRAKVINDHLWDPATGVYRDLDVQAGRQTVSLSAATLYALFVGLADPTQARQVAATVRGRLLAPGGLRTTTETTGQQWDRPNGWAPLQWVAVQGLRRYGETGLADEIATRWLATVRREYAASGRLLEKYDVEEVRPGGGGEYPLQDGFGWTNGVSRALLPAADASAR